jgi:hypothetical protein
MQHSYSLPDMTILNGATDSNALLASTSYRTASSFELFGPAALTGTVTVQVDSGSGVYKTLQSPPGTDVAIAATKSIVVLYNGWVGMRLHSDAAEGADRVFAVRAVEEF